MPIPSWTRSRNGQQLGRTEPERRARWRRKVRGEQPAKELDGVRLSVRSGRPYGAEDWVEVISHCLGIVRKPRRGAASRALTRNSLGWHKHDRVLCHVSDNIECIPGDNSVSVHHYCFPCIKSVSWIHGKTPDGSDNSVSVHHYCFPCIKSVSWIHGKTSKTDRR